MENKLNNKKIFITYALICLTLVALSFLGLIFNSWLWVLPVSIAICSFLGAFCLLLLVKSDLSPATTKANFLIALLVRYALMAIGLVICGLLVKYTTKDIADLSDKKYFIIILAAIPYFATSISLYLTK